VSQTFTTAASVLEIQLFCSSVSSHVHTISIVTHNRHLTSLSVPMLALGPLGPTTTQPDPAGPPTRHRSSSLLRSPEPFCSCCVGTTLL